MKLNQLLYGLPQAGRYEIGIVNSYRHYATQLTSDSPDPSLRGCNLQ